MGEHIKHMRSVGFDSDRILTTFCRLRPPNAEQWISNLTTFPGLLRSLFFDMKNENKVIFFFKMSLISLCLALPYLFLCFILLSYTLFIVSSDFLSLLGFLYLSGFLIFFTFSIPKLAIIVNAFESRENANSRGFNFTHSPSYYLLVLMGMTLLFIPTTFFAFTDPITSEDIRLGAAYFYLFFAVLALLAAFFHVGYAFLINRNYSVHMHTQFTTQNLRINGKLRGYKYLMTYDRDEIASFILIKFAYSLLSKNQDDTTPSFLIPKKPLPEDFSILYLSTKSGSLHLCSYFIQGKELTEDISAFLTQQYPDIPIHIQKPRDNNLSDFPYRSLSFLPGNRTLPGLRTPFLFPSSIKLQKIESSSLESFEMTSETDVVNKFAEYSFGAFLKRPEYAFESIRLIPLYAMGVLLTVWTISIFPLVSLYSQHMDMDVLLNQFVTMYLLLFFTMVCCASAICPPKRLYLLGLAAIPSISILVFHLLFVLRYTIF